MKRSRRLLIPVGMWAAGVVPVGASASAPSDVVLRVDGPHPVTMSSETTAVFSSPTGTTEFQVLPGVVVQTVDGASPQPGARFLGGRSWRIAVATPSEALAVAKQLSRATTVSSAFPDVALPTRRLADDPYREAQWYLDFIDMDVLHAISLGSPDIRVAVIDSGIDHTHPDLIDRVDAPYDAFSDDSDPSPDPGEYCHGGGSGICDEHGTAVSGVIVATANNGIGIHGMCPECTLIPIKMLGESSSSLSSSVAAFEHAIEQDAAVINNSWGYTTRVAVPEPLAEVIGRALTETRGGLGSVVVFAAGNDGRELSAEEMPALPGVLCVSAIDNYGYPVSYTNTGASVDVAAPSATVSISPVGDITTDFGGTSAAAPVTSGLAAWILSEHPEMSAAEVVQLIIDTAEESPYVTHDETGHHDTYGYGVVAPDGVYAALYTDDPTPDDSGSSDLPPDNDSSESPGNPSDGKGSGCAVAASASGGLLSWTLGIWAIGLRRRPAGCRAVR